MLEAKKRVDEAVAPLVQLDRMSAYGTDGRRFESCTGWYFFLYVLSVALDTTCIP